MRRLLIHSFSMHFEPEHFFKGTLQPDLLCVYHIPFQEDDRWQICSMLSHNLHRWNQEQGKVAILSGPYQYVEF